MQLLVLSSYRISLVHGHGLFKIDFGDTEHPRSVRCSMLIFSTGHENVCILAFYCAEVSFCLRVLNVLHIKMRFLRFIIFTAHHYFYIWHNVIWSPTATGFFRGWFQVSEGHSRTSAKVRLVALTSSSFYHMAFPLTCSFCYKQS